MKTKLSSFFLISLASLLLNGCCSSRCGSPPPAAEASGQTDYDPERDVTTINKGGYTWQLKGKVSDATAITGNSR